MSDDRARSKHAVLAQHLGMEPEAQVLQPLWDVPQQRARALSKRPSEQQLHPEFGGAVKRSRTSSPAEDVTSMEMTMAADGATPMEEVAWRPPPCYMHRLDAA